MLEVDDYQRPESGFILVVERDNATIGLFADQHIGKRDIVIKPLGPRFSDLHIFGGASILGDGSISLVLNPSALVDIAIQSAPVLGQLRDGHRLAQAEI
jgi:two-component system chemotaxis sensor kinase CheA